MSGRQRRRVGAVVFTLTSLIWAHQWFPLLLVVGFVAWLVVHHRLEAGLGHALLRGWHRAWPPATAVVACLLAGSIAVYATSSVPLGAKLVPIFADGLALSILAFGPWWSGFATARR